MFYNIDYHITDRCNRKCVSCGHFSPLVPTSVKNKSLETVEEDLKALARFPGITKILTLTGGECTIHPNLREIVLMALEYFPDTTIHMVSNGLLPERLIALKDIFLEHDNILLTLTDYIHDNTVRLFNELGDTKKIVRYDIQKLGDNMWTSRDKFYRAFICEEECTTLDQASRCHARLQCPQLVDKKLYPCQYLGHYHYFQDYFKDQIKVGLYGDEFIELDKCNTVKEIENFMCGWVQEICLHCLEPLRYEGLYENTQPLVDTKYELSEWYVKSMSETNQLNNKDNNNGNQ